MRGSASSTIAFEDAKGEINASSSSEMNALLNPGMSMSIRDVPNLPAACYEALSEFAVMTSRVVEAKTSKDGSTTKLLIELGDKRLVEAVVIRHREKEQHWCVLSLLFVH